MKIRDVVAFGQGYVVSYQKENSELILECTKPGCTWEVDLTKLDTLEDWEIELRKHAETH